LVAALIIQILAVAKPFGLVTEFATHISSR
jgi:hypothetical protein